jgi:flagellar FliJ protein
MAATDTSFLDTLVELTQKHLGEAGVRLAESRKSEQRSKDFMNTLLGYRTDYTMEMQRQMSVGMDAMTVSTYRAFLTTLDNAIDQAQIEIKKLGNIVIADQENWQDQHMKINAYETLIDRRVKVLKVKESRIDQRQTDELSSQMRQRQASNAHSTPGL